MGNLRVANITYTEPTEDANSQPLTNLASTRIYYDKGAGAVMAKETPASAGTGGGDIATEIDIPRSQGGREPISATLWATAVDTDSDESVISNIQTVSRPRQILWAF